MITLRLTHADSYEGVYIPLPATPAEIGDAWAIRDSISDDIASTRIVGAISNVAAPAPWYTLRKAAGSAAFY